MDDIDMISKVKYISGLDLTHFSCKKCGAKYAVYLKTKIEVSQYSLDVKNSVLLYLPEGGIESVCDIRCSKCGGTCTKMYKEG